MVGRLEALEPECPELQPSLFVIDYWTYSNSLETSGKVGGAGAKISDGMTRRLGHKPTISAFNASNTRRMLICITISRYTASLHFLLTLPRSFYASL